MKLSKLTILFILPVMIFTIPGCGGGGNGSGVTCSDSILDGGFDTQFQANEGMIL